VGDGGADAAQHRADEQTGSEDPIRPARVKLKRTTPASWRPQE
jgi:hypothetical protein